MTKRILIVNRGEIAIRIARAVNELNYIAVGLFTDNEIAASHLEHCHEWIYLQGKDNSETYLNVDKILKLCNEHKVPVVPFGTGTSLEGHAVGNENGITISLEKMNKVLSVNAADFDCRVQANVTRKQLNEYLREDGVFFPIDPGADAAIGGMVATFALLFLAVFVGLFIWLGA